MEIKYTEEELNSIDKALLIKMFLIFRIRWKLLQVKQEHLMIRCRK